jgi:Outer membrane lipoprotein-sorting protein
MKSCRIVLNLTILLFCPLCLSINPASSQEITAREVMEEVDDRNDGDRSTADMKMMLIDKNGTRRNRTIRSFGIDQGEDQYHLMFFLAPGDVKGTGFLTYDYESEDKEDDQWLYLPALKKVKRIAASDKSGSFMGSDFSYADQTKRRLRDYMYTFHAKQSEVTIYGKKCWVIESIPKNRKVITETGYTKSILFIRQDNMVVVRAIHYLKNKGTLKYYDVKNMQEIDGIWTGLEIHMTRKRGNETVHQTILTLENVQYNQNGVDKQLFTTRRLEKGL